MRPCLEIKRTLSGEERRFACELVTLADTWGVLRYAIDRDWVVAGVQLSPGCLTYGVYWRCRPYNVYWWLDPEGASLGFYFNICDQVKLSPRSFRWRDLAVDVLVRPDGSFLVLDEDELPGGLPEALVAYVREAREAILRSAASLTEEVRLLVAPYLARESGKASGR